MNQRFILLYLFLVSSRTLWLGHLPKMINEIDVREQLEPYGEISDINVI
jgi:RNA recognition motif-containing protein